MFNTLFLYRLIEIVIASEYEKFDLEFKTKCDLPSFI